MVHATDPFRSARRGLIVAALLGLMPGVALAASSTPAGVSSLTGAVRLLDPGVEPRVTLRYDLEPGQTHHITVDGTQSVSIEMLGETQSMEVPTTRFVAEGVTSEAPGGATRIDFRYIAAGLAEPGDQTMGEAIQSAFEPLLGLTGWSIVDDRGQTLDVGFDGVDDLPAELASSFSDFERLGSEMSVPLPEEPVGIGARWEAAMTVPAQGMEVEQVIEYTLNELQGDTVTLGLTTTQTAAPGPFEPPSLPGTVAELVELTGNGAGTMRIDTTRLSPTSSAELRMQMRLSVEGTPMTMDMSGSVEIRPGAEPVWPADGTQGSG